MFFRCSTESFNLGYELLKNFIASCHWTYFKRYNVFGHHGSGWGFAYIPEGNEKLIVKRDINPIYFSDWENLTKIKTRFLLVHARKMIQPEDVEHASIDRVIVKHSVAMTGMIIVVG